MALKYTLTKDQKNFLLLTVPFDLYMKFNTPLSGQAKILTWICEIEEYTHSQRMWLNTLRAEYIKMKRRNLL